MKKRFLSITLALCMLLSIVPMTPIVATAETVTSTTVAKDITLGTSAIQEPTEVVNGSNTHYTPNSYIYFGKNGATDIKWRVLDADKANDGKTDGMFLLSEYVLATYIRFNANNSKGNQYQGSDTQTWCKNFAENFSLVEQKAMFGVTKPDNEKNLYSIEWGESSLTTEDKLFFLSAEELTNYVGNYDSAPGLAATDVSKASAYWWWLRSPRASTTDSAGVVSGNGAVYISSVDGVNGARPALNLNPASVLFTSAAYGGKSSNVAGGVTENSNFADITGNDGYKLTLLDESRNGFSAYLKSLSGNMATVSYSGAKTETNEYISVIIKNGNEVKYYGRITSVFAASGDVDITLPNNYNPANGDVLCVFNEQYNGDNKTDYASELVVLPDYRWYTANTDATTFTISTVSELVGFANLVNGRDLPAGVSEHVNFSGKTVKLANDIDLSCIANWEPIGRDGSDFRGTFDGNNKTNSNLTVNSTGQYDSVGLFGKIHGATVKDLTVSGNVTGTGDESFVGGIVGELVVANIENCSFSGSVTGNGSYVGGIVGYSVSSLISKCCNYATVSGSALRMGGIAGSTSYNIRYCYNRGNVTSTKSDGTPFVGGIAGKLETDSNALTATSCYNTGRISATGTNAEIGGTVGIMRSITPDVPITVDDFYYLDGVAVKGIGLTETLDGGSITGEAVDKSSTAFGNGEVAWLLQNAAADADGLVWGQTLTGSNKDAYPVFANESGSNKVYRVTLVIDEDTTNVKYVNGGTITVADPTALNGYTFGGWYTAQIGGTKFEFTTVITADTTLYARWTPIPADAPTVSGSNAEVTYGQYTDKKIGVTVTNQEGYTYSYQWYDSSENKIAGAIESTYTVPNNLTAGSHDYYCVVTAKRSDNGETATTKKKITIAVNKGTASFTEPTSQNDITYGATLDTVGLTDGWTWADGNTVPTVTNNGYTAYFTPADTANYDWEAVNGWNTTLKRVERTVAVTINKASQSAPTGITSIAESIDGKADGKIKGVTTEMEYSKGGNGSYTPITGTEITGLEDGTYYVRYKADDNYNASEYTRITVNPGRKLTVTVPTTQVGYTLTANKTELVWNDSVELTFALANGYSKLNNFTVKVNGNPITLDAGKYTVTNAQSDITVTVVGVADITAPTGEIKLGTNSWKTFLNNITFGLFFKDTEEVTITATDNSGETVTIEYLLSDTKLTVSELSAKTFTAYSDKFNINPNNEYVIYAKLTDTTGNVTYINSNGIVLDDIVPVISGITDGETYCAEQTVTVTEKYVDTVTVNGTPVTLDANGQFTLSPANGTQTVVVTDKAGNVSAEMIVTVNDGHEGGTATCTKKAVCKHCGLEYGEVDNSNHDLEHNKENAATVTTTGNKEYWYCKDCKNNFSDKDGKNVIDLKDTVISKLAPEIIDGKGQSLTLGEKKELTFRSNAAYSDFIRVELDGKAVDGKNYIVKEGSTIVTLKADYVATLSAGEHTLGIVSESGTATTTFTVNAKVVNDNTSPATGDNSHMALWFALLFVSGGLLTVTGVYGKKKKYSAK